MKKIVIIILMGEIAFAGTGTRNRNDALKQLELQRLHETLMKARKRVRDSWNFRGGDLLLLLPTVSAARRAPYEGSVEPETYISMSVSTSQIWKMNDQYDKRAALRRKTLKNIEMKGFIIRKYIERKYLLKRRLWKFNQIKMSIDNPVEIAEIDEKIDNLMVKIQEVEIGIKKGYTEIECICVDVEG